MTHSTNHMGYSVVHRDDTVSRKEAEEIFKNFVSLLESAPRLTSEFSLSQFFEEEFDVELDSK